MSKHTPGPWKNDIASRHITSGEEYVGYLQDFSEDNVAFVLCAVNSHDELLAACEALLTLTDEFEGSTYGVFLGGDPRQFLPDEEVCTPEEIERWRAACQEWNEGRSEDRGPGCATFGDATAWTGGGFGMGTTTFIVPEIQQARAVLAKARGEL